MRALGFLTLALACTVFAAAPLFSRAPQMTAAGSPQVTISSGGMEGLSEIQVQVHLAADAYWRELVDLDEAELKQRVEYLAKDAPGLALVDGPGSSQTPRLLVIAVGHVIADAEGNRDTSATNLSISLNQPVSVRRPLPSGRAILATGTTWHRSILITGLNESMRQRVDDKLAHLIGQFRDEYLRANRPETEGPQPSGRPSA